MMPAAGGTAFPEMTDAVVDIEFEVIADDIHAVGRSMMVGRRSPTLPHAIVFGAIGAVFWVLGNPIGAVLMVAFAVVIFANPRVAFLDRWWAKRMPGNRIGSRWRIWAGPAGIGYSSQGITGHVEWPAIESVTVGEEAIVVMGPHSSAFASIPRRAMTPWQEAALVDLARQHAPQAKLIR